MVFQKVRLQYRPTRWSGRSAFTAASIWSFSAAVAWVPSSVVSQSIHSESPTTLAHLVTNHCACASMSPGHRKWYQPTGSPAARACSAWATCWALTNVVPSVALIITNCAPDRSGAGPW